MSQNRGRYTLHYTIPADTLAGIFPYEQEALTFIDALSKAWVSRAAGDTIHGISYNKQAILEGKDFMEALDLISQKGAQPGVLPTEIVQQIGPEILAERLARLVEIARERLAEAALYRDWLEDLYKAADEAIKQRNLELLFKITGKLAFWYVPSESDVKEWGKDFLHAWQRDANWLRFTKKALEKIKAAVEQIDAPEGSRSAELKQEIIELVEDGLIPHI